ncbi:hypothetical protein O1611_g6201 [Lasiodiplodia mahajangana]|uniref:Uncharacterized protein n=1 Tax=Lasiodiplodia mahajangana TaxID=1108764 RepID=A0ACC2JJ15_9PEZI|nr:hypothetical protein O1611_g6201 [Lasiodiplodia mahajangana]
MATSSTRQRENESEAKGPTLSPVTNTEGDENEEGGVKLAVLELCKRRWEMNSYDWELEVLPRAAIGEISKTPSINSYDSQLLLIAENWIRWLQLFSSLEVGEPSPEDPKPFALTRLNHLITRCHNLIYEHYTNYSRNSRSQEKPPLYPETRKAIETDVDLARSLMSKLAIWSFGAWLACINHRNVFSDCGKPDLYNVDFDKMEVEYVFFIDKGEAERSVIHNGIGMLFPGAQSGEFCVHRMRHDNRVLSRTLGVWDHVSERYHSGTSYTRYYSSDGDEDSNNEHNSSNDKEDSYDDRDSNKCNSSNDRDDYYGSGDSIGVLDREDIPRTDESGFNPGEQRRTSHLLDESGASTTIDSDTTRLNPSPAVDSMNLRVTELENRMSKLQDEIRQVNSYMNNTMEMIERMTVSSENMAETAEAMVASMAQLIGPVLRTARGYDYYGTPY